MSEEPAGGQPGGRDTLSVHEISPALARAAFGSAVPWVKDFADTSYEWRRLTAELVGTFLLVLVAAGGGVVAALHGADIGRAAEVVAPALMVMAVILGMGAVSGAHLNPVVSVAFSLRGEFPWRRVPLYVCAQAAGAVLACLFLWAMFGKIGGLGSTVPGSHVTDVHAMWMEAVLTFGLVTTILGTASGAQNVGPLSALAVAGYIALAGLWSSPVSGASMNPVRTLGPDVVTGDFGHFWLYVVGPTIGMLAAVGLAFVLRGRGHDPTAIRAAQGSLGAIVIDRIAAPPTHGSSSPAPPSPAPPNPAPSTPTDTREEQRGQAQRP